MGVRRLMSTVTRHYSSACPLVNLSDHIRGWKEFNNQSECSKECNNQSGCVEDTPYLVVDGMSLVCFAYEELEWQYMGAWREFVENIRTLVRYFRASGCEPVFCFDSSTSVEQEKMENWLDRRRRDIQQAREFYDQIEQGRERIDLGLHTILLPPSLCSSTRRILSEVCGVRVWSSCVDADREIDACVALLSKQNKCCGLLSNDSDFFIYHLPPQAPFFFLPWNYKFAQLDVGETMLHRFDQRAFASALHLPLLHLPLLACLMGNDFVDEDKLKRVQFYKRCCQSYGIRKGNTNALLPALRYLLDQLEHCRGDDDFIQAIQADIFGQPSEVDLQSAIQFYNTDAFLQETLEPINCRASLDVILRGLCHCVFEKKAGADDNESVITSLSRLHHEFRARSLCDILQNATLRAFLVAQDCRLPAERHVYSIMRLMDVRLLAYVLVGFGRSTAKRLILNQPDSIETTIDHIDLSSIDLPQSIPLFKQCLATNLVLSHEQAVSLLAFLLGLDCATVAETLSKLHPSLWTVTLACAYLLRFHHSSRVFVERFLAHSCLVTKEEKISQLVPTKPNADLVDMMIVVLGFGDRFNKLIDLLNIVCPAFFNNHTVPLMRQWRYLDGKTLHCIPDVVDIMAIFRNEETKEQFQHCMNIVKAAVKY